MVPLARKLWRNNMQREIKPEDVPAMMKSEELEFGNKLEFGDTSNFDTIGARILKFDGFNTDTHEFICHYKNERTPRLYAHVRFPLPDLLAGDPVITMKGDEYKRHFSHFDSDGFMNCYIDGYSKWTDSAGTSCWGNNWRLPTRTELEPAYSQEEIAAFMARWNRAGK